ncbi:hypothetical protein SB4_01125 [Sphingomonas sanguinis]|uniref:Uncharacterized protein n=1 Tax=Sphingomonas sanguinis TaxID=33051 RepID=A0A147J334_9SPHN|nr:hypothetical protein SB4_01125 [Sphingomonas sanguinis]KTW11712.1 hypothetical protein NS258_11395 [Sphingomonas sanguinis]
MRHRRGKALALMTRRHLSLDIVRPLLLGILMFASLTLLDHWGLWPHSAWRAAIVGLLCSLVSSRICQVLGLQP